MPQLSISKTQLDKLGRRLRDATVPDPADLDLFEEVMSRYDEALQFVISILRDNGHHPTDRLKVTGTVIAKLRRNHGSRLGSIQDLAGARVVLGMDLAEQDRTVQAFCDRMDVLGATHIITDRRADPRAGYRAVHVITKPDGIPVEVQFRTEIQHLWAQVFERMADTWGRQIRYGGSPDPDPRSPEHTRDRAQAVDEVIAVSEMVGKVETDTQSIKRALVRAFEVIEAVRLTGAAREAR